MQASCNRQAQPRRSSSVGVGRSPRLQGSLSHALKTAAAQQRQLQAMERQAQALWAENDQLQADATAACGLISSGKAQLLWDSIHGHCSASERVLHALPCRKIIQIFSLLTFSAWLYGVVTSLGRRSDAVHLAAMRAPPVGIPRRCRRPSQPFAPRCGSAGRPSALGRHCSARGSAGCVWRH